MLISAHLPSYIVPRNHFYSVHQMELQKQFKYFTILCFAMNQPAPQMIYKLRNLQMTSIFGLLTLCQGALRRNDASRLGATLFCARIPHIVRKLTGWEKGNR